MQATGTANVTGTAIGGNAGAGGDGTVAGAEGGDGGTGGFGHVVARFRHRHR